MYSEPRAHAVPLFIASNILPLQMLYAEKVSSIMFDVSCFNAPSNICNLFIKATSKHKHETRFFSSEIIMSRLQEWISIRVLFQFWKLWSAIPNEFRWLSEGAFRKHFYDLLLSIMETEDDYVEVTILLQKIAKSPATT